MKGQAAPLPSHLEEIARAIRKQIDGKREGWGSANFVVRREVTKLAKLAGVRRLTSHSATFRRALADLQGRELTRGSQRRALASSLEIITRWLSLEHLMPPPEPKPERKLPPLKRHKAIRRFRHNGAWLEEWGVEMGDRLLVAMTGDVKPGELAYVRITTFWTREGETTSRYYDAFHFVCDVDETCIGWARPKGKICLRNYGKRCMGKHAGAGTDTEVYAFGRVCAVERDRRPVETTLGLRPYDEREGGPTTSPKNTPEVTRHVAPMSDDERRRKLDDLRRRLDHIGDDITDCSQRMRLEKEIFDIEHPKDPAWNDWSAWEEGGAA